MSERRGPQTAVAAAALLIIAIIVALAFAVVAVDRREQRAAERRVQDRALLTAEVTQSLFATVAAQGAAERGVRLGGASAGDDELERYVEQNQLPWALLLGPDGATIATGGDPPAAVRRARESQQRALEAMGAKAPFWLSDHLPPGPSGSVFLALGVPGPGDKGRVLLQGVEGPALSQFLSGYLVGIPGVRGANAYIVDRNGLVVGSPVAGQPTGALPEEPGLARVLAKAPPTRSRDFEGEAERRLSVAAVGGSDWRVLLSVRTSDLDARSGAALPWIILGLLALAGLAVLLLLRRSASAAVALAASHDELQRSHAELQRSNAELEQFASVASHDLQEPLRKIQAFGDQLGVRFGDDLGEEGQDYLRRMRSAARRMSVLIEDLLRFSRVTTHTRPNGPVDLEEITAEVLIDLETTLRDSGGHVEVGRLPVVDADPVQMRQLLQNLIANALKFAREGVAPAVDVRTVPSPEPDMVAFAVSDNGIGFEPQYAERIFRVFERLHPRDVYAGTGIGLALCRKIVERHGGTITADGEDGAGATFTVVMPAAALAASGGSPPREVAHA